VTALDLDRAWSEVTTRVRARHRPVERRYRDPVAVAETVDPTWKVSPATQLINDALVELMSPQSPDNALAVFMPPQEGKSQLVSRRFPEWGLDADPGLRFAIVSYEQDTALRWGRDIKQDIALNPDTLHIQIRRDSSAAGRWETPAGGGVYCVGVGGALTGRPVDVLIIDDPVKDREAAESEVLRKTAWNWWESVALTRLAPRARVVLIQTRWHEDDLAGRIFSRPSPLKWRQIVIPAIATSADDPLGREVGEELPSVRGREPGYFRNLQANMSNYVFSGVYQQEPTAAEGNFFRRASFRYWRMGTPWNDGRETLICEGKVVTLADCWRFATVDVAGSAKTTADYTVVSMWCVTVEGDLILLDRARAQVGTHDHFQMAQPLVQRWGDAVLYVERGYFSSTLVKDARNAGIGVAEVVADTDKVTRAIPAAGRVHAGKVWFPADASWLEEWTNELAIFPSGTHDDQVDTLSYAARILVSEWTQPKPPERHRADSTAQAVAAAHSSATGNGAHEVDFMNLQY
jgi:predicted phage terminase large subunit-like protein